MEVMNLDNENKEQNNLNNQPKKQKNGLLRAFIFCLLTVILVVLIFWVFSDQSKGKEVSLTYFDQELQAGHIDEVYLNAEEITFKTKNGYVTYVFVDKYISISRDGVMNMQAPVLRDLLTGALIANGLKRNYDILASNQYLQKVMMEVYTKFVIRIINKEFSVIADKIVFDTLQYWINRFFLTQILSSNDTPQNIETNAKKHFKFIDELKYDEIKQQYDSINPQKISELLELLKLASPRMKALNLAKFLSSWINYYYIPSMLAVDNIEYLIFMMITLLNGNNIISIAASDMVKEAKNIKSFKGELLKLIV